MSAHTKAALDDAIAAHLFDEHEGAQVTGYVLQVAGSTTADLFNGEARYLRATSEGQDLVTTLGIVQYAWQKLQRRLLQLT